MDRATRPLAGAFGCIGAATALIVGANAVGIYAGVPLTLPTVPVWVGVALVITGVIGLYCGFCVMFASPDDVCARAGQSGQPEPGQDWPRNVGFGMVVGDAEQMIESMDERLSELRDLDILGDARTTAGQVNRWLWVAVEFRDLGIAMKVQRDTWVGFENPVLDSAQARGEFGAGPLQGSA